MFFLLLPVFAFVFTTSAQGEYLPRSVVQQRHMQNALIIPQMKVGKLEITQESQIDSLFTSWQKGWRAVAADSMKPNPTVMNRAEFENLDAYLYFWGLASITRNISVDETYGDVLARYMGASLRQDLIMLQRIPNPNIIDEFNGGNLGNTLSIGSAPKASRPAFEVTYALYADYMNLFQSLKNNPDTAVSRRAQQQLNRLNTHFYSMNARKSFYEEKPDEAFMYFVTGMSVNNYSKSRAIDLGKKLYRRFATTGEKDKAYALLNTLTLNTTADNLNRDTLALWYGEVDSVAGPKAYLDFTSKLSMSAFKNTGKKIKLPLSWHFVTNAVSSEKIASAKFVLFDFWYTSCAPCLNEIPELNDFYNKLKDRPDVLFISVNTDYKNGKNPPGFVNKRSKELKIGYPVFYDNAGVGLAEQFGIEQYPTKTIVSIRGEEMVKTDLSAITTTSFEVFLNEKK